MFGLLISGRPVNASPQAVSQTQYAFRIPANPPFSHIAIFLLPGSGLPIDAGATVWIQIPPSQDFSLLGALTATKQSAIFKINVRGSGQTVATTMQDNEGDVMVDETFASSYGTSQSGPEIVVGVSLEPAAQVGAQLASLKNSAPSNALVARQPPQSSTTSPVTTKILAQRIIGNAFNFLASFGDTVPLKSFQDWWIKFEKKVELDPTFLEREQG